MVEYSLANNSYLRFYLAPKVSRPADFGRNHKLTHNRLVTRSKRGLQGITKHDHGMKRCLRRFSDLLEEKDGAAKEHVLRLGDDKCCYTKSNKMIIPSRTVQLTK